MRTQHIPQAVSRPFAELMDRCSALKVKETADDDLIMPSHVYSAPANRRLPAARVIAAGSTTDRPSIALAQRRRIVPLGFATGGPKALVCCRSAWTTTAPAAAQNAALYLVVTSPAKRQDKRSNKNHEYSTERESCQLTE